MYFVNSEDGATRLCLFRRRQNRMRKAIKAMRTNPPITPPTIGPVLEDFFDWEREPTVGMEVLDCVGAELLACGTGIFGEAEAKNAAIKRRQCSRMGSLRVICSPVLELMFVAMLNAVLMLKSTRM